MVEDPVNPTPDTATGDNPYGAKGPVQPAGAESPCGVMALIGGVVSGLCAVLIMLSYDSSDPAQAMVQSMGGTVALMVLVPVSLVLLVIGVNSLRSERQKAALPTTPHRAAVPGGIGAGWLCGRCGRPVNPGWGLWCGFCRATFADYPPVAQDTPPGP